MTWLRDKGRSQTAKVAGQGEISNRCRAALDLDSRGRLSPRGSCRPNVPGSASRLPLLQHLVVQLFSSPVVGGLDERHHYGMGFAGLGGELRLIEGGDEE